MTTTETEFDFLAAVRATRRKPVDIRSEKAAAWTARLAAFLDSYRPLRSAVPLPRSTRQVVDTERLQGVLAALRAPLAHARDEGVLLNPWVMAGLRRNEVRNAAVLASFFSPRACGRLGVDFLDAFLEPLRPNPAIPGRPDLEAGYYVRTEHYASGNGRDRVDLTVEGKSFVLGIEIKIDAPEGPLQLERYVETIRAWGQRQGKSAAVIFLAPFPAGNADVSSANWRSIATASRKVIARTSVDRTEAQKLLQLFVRHAAGF